MKKSPKRVLLVDDHPMVRERLAEVIEAESDLTVCGHAEDRHNALQLSETVRPDLVVADLQLKNSHGLDLIKDLYALNPELAVLVVSMFDSPVYAERAIRAGARGYVTKQEATNVIVEAIRRVLAGELYLGESLVRHITAKQTGPAKTFSPAGVSSLTDRELEVFEQMGLGLSSRRIAERMGLDASTVDTYRARIKDKLQIEDPSELLEIAITWVHSAPQRRASL